MTENELRALEARYRRAFGRSEQIREERNAAIRAALADGWTHARLAEVMGKSRGWVSQFSSR